jgi:hypothetical protein
MKEPQPPPPHVPTAHDNSVTTSLTSQQVADLMNRATSESESDRYRYSYDPSLDPWHTPRMSQRYHRRLSGRQIHTASSSNGSTRSEAFEIRSPRRCH